MDPPLPLAGRDLRAVGLSLAALVYALDEITSGREIV
jgi:hypothetical protein